MSRNKTEITEQDVTRVIDGNLLTSQYMVVCGGQALGDRRLVRGITVKTLSGNPFYDGKYYVTETTHEVSGGKHITNFTAEANADTRTGGKIGYIAKFNEDDGGWSLYDEENSRIDFSDAELSTVLQQLMALQQPMNEYSLEKDSGDGAWIALGNVAASMILNYSR